MHCRENKMKFNANEVKSVEHPSNKGVYLKHFFSSNENDRLNNAEVTITKGSMIAPHIHEASSEFFYVVSGRGYAYFNGEWIKAYKGDCLMAKTGEEHGFRNDEDENLVLFCTFSPYIK
jgi:mannose-6-phosphate isomerase-like protein (cupin superfamily)